MTVGTAVTPAAPSAAPSRPSANEAWAWRDDHTSVTTKLPSSAMPAACIRSPSGQSPSPVDASMPSSRLTASYSRCPTPSNLIVTTSATAAPSVLAPIIPRTGDTVTRGYPAVPDTVERRYPRCSRTPRSASSCAISAKSRRWTLAMKASDSVDSVGTSCRSGVRGLSGRRAEPQIPKPLNILVRGRRGARHRAAAAAHPATSNPSTSVWNATRRRTSVAQNRRW